MADYNEDAVTSSELVAWAEKQVAASNNHFEDWATEAVKSFAMVAGNQWDETIKNSLEADGRPVFTFNRIAGFIRGICGLETSTRNQVQFYAREVEDSGVSEVKNAAAAWVRQGCDADDEESDAFKDMLTCGLGWTETYYTNEEDPEGTIVIERIDPMHMRWDQSARKRGLSDSRWRERVKFMTMDDIKEMWGKEKANQIGAYFADDNQIRAEQGEPHDAVAARNYDSGYTGQQYTSDQLPVCQFQYYKIMPYVRAINPLSGAVEELARPQYDRLKQRFPEIEGVTYRKRQYRQLIYCGGVELEDAALPGSGFTFNVITGVRDRNTGRWYGFVRDLIDPQQWINKFFSSMADVVASQAKGGLMAEADAFVNKRQAEEQWADPRSILWMKKGALQNGSVKERGNQGVPQGLSQLLEFTVSSLPHVAGVNLEFLGLAGREQPGVLEHQRKQAAIATLAEFFNAFRLYRKQQGRTLLQFMNEFISDGRLVRIVGKKMARYVPLAKDPASTQYDIIVDEAPTSPDQKNRTWDALTQLLPAAASIGFPIPPEVIDYAPFPQSLIDDWKKFAEGDAGLPPQVKAQMQQMQEQLQALQAENQQLKSKKDEAMQKLQIDQQKAQQDAALNQQTAQQEAALAIEKFRQEMALEQQKFLANMELERQRMMADIQIERERLDMQREVEKERIANAPKPQPNQQ